jgi:hypothetical protein
MFKCIVPVGSCQARDGLITTALNCCGVSLFIGAFLLGDHLACLRRTSRSRRLGFAGLPLTSKCLSVSETIDERSRAWFAAGATCPADGLVQLWKQARPKDTPESEWSDSDGPEEIDINIGEL